MFFTRPESLVGTEVSVSVVVDEVLGRQAFQALTPDPSGQGFLVIHEPGESPPVGLHVAVTGVVQEFNAAALGERMDIRLEGNVFTAFEGEYGIVASEVVPHLAGPAGPGTRARVRDAVAFFANPTELEGEKVVVNVLVDETISDYLFRIVAEDATGDGILVAHDGSATPVEGSFLKVKGVVERFNAVHLVHELGIAVKRALRKRLDGQLGLTAHRVEVLVP